MPSVVKCNKCLMGIPPPSCIVRTFQDMTRLTVPAAIVLYIALFFGSHFGVLSAINISTSMAGEEVTIYHFLVHQNRPGKRTEMAMWKRPSLSGGFTRILTYLKLLLPLLWRLAPNQLSVKCQRRLLLTINALANIGVVDIVARTLGVAVLLVFIGGPDE